MKVIDQIFALKRPTFSAFGKLKDALSGAQNQRNEIASFVGGLNDAVTTATVAVFDDPTIKNFEALVLAQMKFDTATKVSQNVFSSIGRAQVAELTESDDARQTLRDALETYAKELSERIEQICTDARELAERAGIDFSEPPSVSTLRSEMETARDGIQTCDDPAASPDFVWRKYAPLIRIGNGGGTLAH